MEPASPALQVGSSLLSQQGSPPRVGGVGLIRSWCQNRVPVSFTPPLLCLPSLAPSFPPSAVGLELEGTTSSPSSAQDAVRASLHFASLPGPHLPPPCSVAGVGVCLKLGPLKPTLTPAQGLQGPGDVGSSAHQEARGSRASGGPGAWAGWDQVTAQRAPSLFRGLRADVGRWASLARGDAVGRPRRYSPWAPASLPTRCRPA